MSGYTPAGWIRPRDAIHAVGRRMYGTEWTGNEDRADPLMLGPGQTPGRGGGARGSDYRGAPDPPPLPYDEWVAKYQAPDTPKYREQYENNSGALERWEMAKSALRRGLETAEYKAGVLNPWTGLMEYVREQRWRLPAAEQHLRQEKAPVPSTPRTNGQLFIAEFVVPSATIVSTSHGERECQRWFEKLMRASPDGDTIGKPERQRDAQERFNVSGAGATRARDRAIEATGALGWRKAGAKRKS